MYNGEIEVSYFAAGIAAHLASDENLDWSKVVMEKNQLISELVSQIKRSSFKSKCTCC